MIPGTYSVLCTRYVWYQVRIMYQIRMYHTCRCTINSTAVSLFVYSLVGGGTHDTNVPPVDAHVWRQLHLSAVARCSDSYCILIFSCFPTQQNWQIANTLLSTLPRLCGRRCGIGRCWWALPPAKYMRSVTLEGSGPGEIGSAVAGGSCGSQTMPWKKCSNNFLPWKKCSNFFLPWSSAK